MATVLTKDPATGTRYTFNSVSALHGALQDYGYIALHADGTPMIQQTFLGGFLLDGAPLNVWIEGVWYEGQKEALESSWANGTIPRPVSTVEAVPAVPMPPDVAANHELYESSQGGAIPTPVLIAGVALLAWKFLR